MHLNHNDDLCAQLGLNGHSQVRADYTYKNLWWTFEGAQVAFGFGDLDNSDCQRILEYLNHPSHNAPLVFVGWNEHHGTERQHTVYPVIRISVADGIQEPARDARKQILKAVS